MALTTNDVKVTTCLDMETFLSNRSDVVEADLATDIIFSYVSPLVDDELLGVFQNVVGNWINSNSTYVGVVNNILILIVFRNMGFKETANISMTAIATWDLVRCINQAALRLHGPMALVSASDGSFWKTVSTPVLSYLASIGTGASGVLAAYVAVERCLCISMPLTVRSLLTRKSVTVTCVTLSVLVIGSYTVIYSTFEFVNLRDARTNATFIMFRFSTAGANTSAILFYIFVISMFYPLSTFSVSCVCTVITVYQLKKACKFRSAIKTDGGNQLSSRDRQVIKMLVVVVVVYIICTVPKIVHYMTLSLVPEFRAVKSYKNIFWVSFYTTSFSSLVDASINIFIFYSMSSQFKQTLRQVLSRK